MVMVVVMDLVDHAPSPSASASLGLWGLGRGLLLRGLVSPRWSLVLPEECVVPALVFGEGAPVREGIVEDGPDHRVEPRRLETGAPVSRREVLRAQCIEVVIRALRPVDRLDRGDPFLREAVAIG